MQEARDLGKEMNFEVETKTYKDESSLWGRFVFFGALLVIVFLLGFVPTTLTERETARQRDAAQANLRLSQIQNRLATAAISAKAGEYEPARIAASDFFTDLRAEIDRRETAFNARQLEAVEPILNRRDETITLLARYDRAAAERLNELYLNYVRAVNPSVPKPH